jgi:hypothetical protein
MRLWSRNGPLNCDSGVEFLGTKGKMFLSKRGKLVVYGEKNETVLNERKPGGPAWHHFGNFVDAIRSNKTPAAEIIEGHRSVALIHLANIALRTGTAIEFDPDREQIKGNPAAAALLARTYRQTGHWAIPQGVEESHASDT